MTLAKYHRKRHFTKTAEPKGKSPAKAAKRAKQLSFVIQKHAATRLHFDFRLELDGVLKSWAVPKGPSLNPSEKRLAVAVEDHPLEYAKFEGTIPAGEYGAGEVIVWDRGHWIPDGDPHESLRKGKLEFELHGERLRGSWRLIQIRGREGGKNWLLMKRNDDAANEDEEITAVETASIVSGRTLEDIAAGKSAVKKRARTVKKTAKRNSRPRQPRARSIVRSRSRSKARGEKASPPALVEPQLAQLVDRVPSGEEWIHEIKHDGYRLMCVVANGAAKLFTRRQLDWTHRFACIATAAAELPVETALLDGEIVALSDSGVSNFQALQNSLQGIESQPAGPTIGSRSSVCRKKNLSLAGSRFRKRTSAVSGRCSLVTSRDAISLMLAASVQATARSCSFRCEPSSTACLWTIVRSQPFLRGNGARKSAGSVLRSSRRSSSPAGPTTSGCGIHHFSVCVRIKRPARSGGRNPWTWQREFNP